MNNINNKKSNDIKYIITAIIFVFFVIASKGTFNSNDLDGFPAIFMEAFVSIHMSLFVLWPLSSLSDNPKEEFKKLFIGRVILLLVCDVFISPMATASIDFISVFIGAFIIVPLSGGWNRMNFVANKTDNNSFKMNNNFIDNNIKFDLATSLVNYLFALSELDKDGLKKITTKKMYDDTLKIVESYETYSKRNIIDNIDIKEINIMFHYTNNNEEFVHALILLSAKDYIEYNNITNVREKMANYEYKVVFKKNNDNMPIKIDLERCPYCSAAILDKSKEECNYCGNLLVEKKNKWLIEKVDKTLIK